MSIISKLGQAIQSLFAAIVQTIRYILEGVARIFRPTDDEYPNIGVQPFEGESDS